ncbi:MAG: DMT family transporter [Candidatus Cellulosilyticum pullistercoris]|uniref:DMT family transporter n=1 Tax=Candidatus Cellulosilyticum pullistercoris TaxID=2838521 RepID=A0A9E2NN50_9FIRM|nr:DMT family transporter [Candidatus Cellulosilyticum pullistercoris]
MNQKYKGIIYILLAAFCFALMNVFVRLSGDLPSVQKSFFRNFVALVFAAIILKKNRIGFSCKKENLMLLIVRSLCGTIGILCNFYAIDHLLLADASMLNKMSPFFAIIFSYIFLKEKVNFVQIFSLIGAFIGCLFIIKPSFEGMEMMPALIGLMGGMGAGAAYTAVRRLGQRGEKGPFIVFFFSTFSCLVTLPYLLINYTPMTGMQIVVLLLAGLSAAGGQFAITAAYCYAPAKEISVYDYSQVIFAAVMGFLLFGQVPDYLSVIGYILICGMAVYMFLYNTGKLERLKKKAN